MKECSLLYKIRTLEKLISRSVIGDVEGCELLPAPSPTQMLIIDYILEHIDENIYQRDLESILSLRRATVSGVLQTMEKNSLIQRMQSPNDARSKKVVLNDNAKKIFLEHKKKIEEIEEYLLKDISKEELIIFLNVLEKMKSKLHEYNV